MTMLNGEPVDTGVPSKPLPGVQPGTPPSRFRGQPTTMQGVDPSNRGMAQIFAIIGLILAFAVPPVGIIMGGVARAMLKPEKSALANWAIILGIVFSILWILATVAFIVFTVWATTAAICVGGEPVNEILGIPFCS